ncbi:MAG: polyprenyl synthetase family protein [Chloroflexi bacterium]|nr:polyprenyl synthetase family protein [Chloroflexota bacterium]
MIQELTILNLLRDDLQRVEQKMRSMGEKAYGPLAEAFLHLIGSGGKRLRPALALAAYDFFAEPASAEAIAVAAAVETLHTATLVHDDLIDGAAVRRGRTTLNAVWGKGAVVLAGDYLFARAAGFAAETESVPVIQLFADTLRIICEGELRQLFSSRQWRQSKETYYPRIFAKTASLFASATRSGAILGGASVEQEQALYDYGYHVGMAFQIVDDILDYSGDEATLGKPVGGDLRQGIVTLPFYHFLQAQPEPEAIIARLDAGEDAIAEVVALVRGSDALELAFGEARAFAAQAKADLVHLPAGPFQAPLVELADFTVSRHV